MRAQYQAINLQVDALDAAVRQAKQAEAESRRALSAMQRASESLKEVAALSATRQTPEVISLLHTATATARLYLQVVQHSSAAADADIQRANKTVSEANARYAEHERALQEALAE